MWDYFQMKIYIISRKAGLLGDKKSSSRSDNTSVVSLPRCLTWQQHSLLPHHSVKALRKSLNEIIGVGHSGCPVDVLCGHGFLVLCTVRYIISYRARKQHGLLGKRWGEERENVRKTIFTLRLLLFLLCVKDEFITWLTVPMWLLSQ